MRILLLLLLSACAPLPEVDRAERALSGAAAPALLPTDQILAQELPAIGTSDSRAALLARADRLRARAAAIRRRPAS